MQTPIYHTCLTKHILKKAAEWGVECKVLAEMKVKIFFFLKITKI